MRLPARTIALLALALVACTEHAADGAAGSGGVSGAGAGAGHNAAGTTAGSAGTPAAGSGAGANAGTSAGSVAGIGAAGDSAGPGSCVIGQQAYPDGSTGIPAGDGCNTCSCDDGSLACTLIGCPDPTECVLAEALDQCCRTFEPHTRAELLADPCLQAYPGGTFNQAQRDACLAKAPAACTNVLCGPSDPYSRVVVKSATGQCVFGDECTSNDDCVTATDVRFCCSCEQAYPKTILQQNPCLQVTGSTTGLSPACETKGCTEPIACLCPSLSAVGCTVRDSFNVCEGTPSGGD